MLRKEMKLFAIINNFDISKDIINFIYICLNCLPDKYWPQLMSKSKVNTDKLDALKSKVNSMPESDKKDSILKDIAQKQKEVIIK